MKTLKQLVREFWLPVVFAALWAFYNLGIHSGGAWDSVRFLNIFGPTFVIASYILAQWFRVKKQQKVESGLHTIEKNIQKLIHDLQESTTNLIGHVNGGDTFCLLSGGLLPNGRFDNLFIYQDGKFPLYDINIRIAKLNVLAADVQKPMDAPRRHDAYFFVESLLPGYAAPLYQQKVPDRAYLTFEDEQTAAFNIFFTARNGGFFQEIRFARIAGTWTMATRVTRNEEVLFEKVDDLYPRDSRGMVEWDVSNQPSSDAEPLAFLA